MTSVSRAGAVADVDLSFLLAQASYVLSTEMTARLSVVGITPRDYCVLSKAVDAGLTQIKLAELCQLDKTTMVVTLDGLEGKDLVQRQPCATDRRARLVVVTPQGKRTLKRAEEVVASVHQDVLDALPAREREGFVNGLTKLAGDRLATPMPCERPPRRRG